MIRFWALGNCLTFMAICSFLSFFFDSFWHLFPVSDKKLGKIVLFNSHCKKFQKITCDTLTSNHNDLQNIILGSVNSSKLKNTCKIIVKVVEVVTYYLGSKIEREANHNHEIK